MKNKWIEAKDHLPESGKEVLICYYDRTSERHEINIQTYFKKGDVMYTRIDRDKNKTKAKRMLSTLFNEEMQIKAEEDGFYFYEWGEDGDTCCRKHADCITHWMPLPEPPQPELNSN